MIDHFSSEHLQIYNIVRFVRVGQRIILNFSRAVNQVHDQSMMPNINEAYKTLSQNKLHSHVLDFIKIFIILCMKHTLLAQNYLVMNICKNILQV